MKSVAMIAASLAFFIGAACVQADQILLSDNFNSENGGVPFVLEGVSPPLTNWNVTKGNVDLVEEGFAGIPFFSSVDHGLFIDLSGSSSGRLVSKTTFDLTPGLYTLTFDLAGNQREPKPPGTDVVAVSLGSAFGESFTMDVNNPWTTISRTISVSTPTDANLVFNEDPNATGLDGFHTGLLLDNVQLATTTTPEPSTLVLAFSGCIGLVVFRARIFVKSRNRKAT